MLENKPASPVALHLTCGTLARAVSVTVPFGGWKPEVEEWEVQNCFLELSCYLLWKSLVFDYCLSMEFLFSSGNFITGYFCIQLRLPFGGSLTRREDKGCHSERGRCSFPGDEAGRGMWATVMAIQKKNNKDNIKKNNLQEHYFLKVPKLKRYLKYISASMF